MTEINQIIIDREVPCTLRDGVTLYSNIYRPSKEGVYPVLLTRLPYNKNLPEFSHRYLDPIRLAMNGYVVIIQDVRGRFASQGEFVPMLQEFEDGYDVVEWASKLPYSNGDVGMFGMSYYAYTQLYAALERPPSLRTIAPAMTGSLINGERFDRGGIIELAAIETWVLDSIAPDFLKKLKGSKYKDVKKEIIHDLNNIEHWHKYMPMKDWPPIKKHPELVPFFMKYFIDNDFDEQLIDVLDKKIEKSGMPTLPAYHIAGWYDSHLGHTLLNYEHMQSSKNNQKLIVGPWSHGFFDSDIGERYFGLHSSGKSIEGEDDLTSIHIKWFDHWLKENNSSIKEEEDPVKIFVMGIDEWRSEKEWPLNRTEYTPFYFESDGSASFDMKSGKLALAPSEKVGKDRYIHDPENPVPSHGGGTLFYNGRNAGPRDQRGISKREDVVVYTSEPLTEPVEVTGWVKAILWASSDAVDADFAVKLVDVFPDGREFNLTDGIVRAKYRNGIENPTLLNDDEIVKYEIDLWATSNVFLPGHAIRIEIASSNFPRFEVNPSTGDSVLNTAEMVKANQTIYHGSKYPSHVILPVIPQ